MSKNRIYHKNSPISCHTLRAITFHFSAVISAVCSCFYRQQQIRLEMNVSCCALWLELRSEFSEHWQNRAKTLRKIKNHWKNSKNTEKTRKTLEKCEITHFHTRKNLLFNHNEKHADREKHLKCIKKATIEKMCWWKLEWISLRNHSRLNKADRKIFIMRVPVFFCSVQSIV